MLWNFKRLPPFLRYIFTFENKKDKLFALYQTYGPSDPGVVKFGNKLLAIKAFCLCLSSPKGIVNETINLNYPCLLLDLSSLLRQSPIGNRKICSFVMTKWQTPCAHSQVNSKDFGKESQAVLKCVYGPQWLKNKQGNKWSKYYVFSDHKKFVFILRRLLSKYNGNFWISYIGLQQMFALYFTL